MRGKFINLVDQRFGRLLVTSRGSNKNGKVMWKCLCDCGEEVAVVSQDIREGITKSCGCLQRDTIAGRNTTHGMTNHPLYFVWPDMKKRIFNEDCPSYKHYGGRGIKICDRWLSIENFIEDMYPSYQEGLSIHRIDNNGDYTPENCKWGTDSIQSHVQRKQSNCSSEYIGVCFHSREQKFMAQICINSKNTILATF